MKRNRLLPLLGAALAALVLSGCATVRLVDSDVQAFSSLAPAAAPQHYRFERLPSQQALGAQQSATEAQAEAALRKFGWLRSEDTAAAPPYTVQAAARTERQIAPDWYGGWDGGWGGGGWGGWGGGRHGFYGGGFMRFPPPTLYRREVSLIVRESASARVVYETHAVHEGVWHDDGPVFAAMFDAALAGFPTPPTGARRINVEIPR